MQAFSESEVLAALSDSLALTEEANAANDALLNLDFESLNEDLAHLKEDPVVQRALEKGLDLRMTVRNLDAQLHDAENEALDMIEAERKSLETLSDEIDECDGILENLEGMLGSFQEHLGALSGEIRVLQSKSSSLQTRLDSARDVEARLAAVATHVSMESGLVSTLQKADLESEEFRMAICSLNSKLSFLAASDDATDMHSSMLNKSSSPTTPRHEQSARVTCKATEELRPVVMELKKVVEKRIVKHLEQKFQDATAKIAMEQERLQKVSFLWDFLREHSPISARELRAYYVATARRSQYTQLRSYCHAMVKLARWSQSRLKEKASSANSSTSASSVSSSASWGRALRKLMNKDSDAASSLVVAHRELRLAKVDALPDWPVPLSAEICAFDVFADAALLHAATETELAAVPVAELKKRIKQAQDEAASLECDELFPEHFRLDDEQARLARFSRAAALVTCLRVLCNAAAAEEKFQREFFFFGRDSPLAADACRDIFGKVFDAVTELVEFEFALDGDNAVKSGECVSLMTLIRVVNDLRRFYDEEDKCEPLAMFLQRLSMSLWPRFQASLRLHCASLRRAAQMLELRAANSNPPDLPVQASAVCLNYATLVASLDFLGSTLEHARGGAQLDTDLRQMRRLMEQLCFRLSESISEPRKRVVFCILNFDLVAACSLALLRAAVLPLCPNEKEEEETECDTRRVTWLRSEATSWRRLVQEHVAVFVESELQAHFSALLDFVKNTEFRLTQCQGQEERQRVADTKVVRSIACSFKSTWRQGIRHCKTAVDELFSDSMRTLSLGPRSLLALRRASVSRDVLELLLAQLVLYYKRFQRLLPQLPAVDTAAVEGELTHVQDLGYEIRQLLSR